MSTTIKDDLLRIRKGILCHQCNMMGVMGAGIAKQIKDKYPKVHRNYMRACQDTDRPVRLGRVQSVYIDDDLIVVNIFGQRNYGRSKGICYTSYEAHEKAWPIIRDLKDETELTVYAPYYIGAGLAGSDWTRIHSIAEKNIPDIVWVKYQG